MYYENGNGSTIVTPEWEST